MTRYTLLLLCLAITGCATTGAWRPLTDDEAMAITVLDTAIDVLLGILSVVH